MCGQLTISMQWLSCVVIFLSAFSSAHAQFINVGNIITNTSLGSIRGRTVSFNNRQFGVYMRVPFAKPPVGNLRFENPVPVDPWTPNVLDASQTQFGPLCPQAPYDRPSMSEDCLQLNIFTPRTNTNAGSTYPVLFWIHGGGYVSGSASEYSERGILENFVSRDIVFVSIQYRLNYLGFWNTRSTVAPGNYGLWDQIMALQWVRNNIHNFGGQSDKITLFGQSAGAASVSYLTLAPSVRGMFNQAIIMSGSAFSRPFFDGDWKTPDPSVEVAKRVNCYNRPVDMVMQADNLQDLQIWGEHISRNLMGQEQPNDPLIKTLRIKTSELIKNFTQQLFTGNFDQMAQTLPQQLMSFVPNAMQDRAMKNCMKTVPIEQLVREQLSDFAYPNTNPNPRVDGILFTKYPSQLADERPAANVMLGVIRDDWSLFDFLVTPSGGPTRQSLEKTKETMQEDIHRFVNKNLFPLNTEAIQKAFTYKYITLPDTVSHNKSDRLYWFDQKTKMISGFIFMTPIYKDAQKWANRGSNVYLYSFDYNQEVPELGWRGAPHASELTYLFNQVDQGRIGSSTYGFPQAPIQFSQTEQAVREYLVQLWTNFVKFGNPTPTPMQGVTWTPLNAETGNYLSISTQLMMKDAFYADDVAFNQLAFNLETMTCMTI